MLTRMPTHPYEHKNANPTPMSTGRYGDSRSHYWRLVVDGNVAYHLMHNVGKSQNKSRNRCEHQDWWVASYWTVLPLDYKPIHIAK
jgi:hypothetical protein